MTNTIVESLLTWLVRASWQTAVLGLIVLLVSWALRDRLEARWRFCLWVVVLTRLAIPAAPSAPWSVFRLAPSMSDAPVRIHLNEAAVTTPTDIHEVAKDGPVAIVQPVGTENQKRNNHRIAADRKVTNAAPAAEISSAAAPNSVSPSNESNVTFGTAKQWFALGWLIGLMMLLIRQAWLHVTLRQRRRTWREISDPVIHDVFRGCRNELRIRRSVNLLITPDGFGRATYGALRPSILLPAILSREELRLVLLHELIHVSRRDVLLDRLANVLVAIHWFNPIAWLALSCMRRERELAYDAAILRRLDEPEFGQYGHVLLKVAERRSASVLIPGTVEVFGKNQSLVRRIHVIAKFKKPMVAGKVLGWLAILGLAAIGLTDAIAQAPGDKGKEPVPPAAKKEDTAKKISIAGVCRDEEGKPISGAQVMLYREDRFDSKIERMRTTATGDDGRFELSELPPAPDDRDAPAWTYVLAVTKNGRGSVVQPLLAEFLAKPFDFKLCPAATLKGRVTNAEGKPVAGARVWSNGLSTDGIQSTWTDADGRFAITDMAAWGEDAHKPQPLADNPGVATSIIGCYFRVLHPDYAKKMAMYRNMPDTVDVVLESAGIIEGKVVDQVTGKPAPGTLVRMQGVNANKEPGGGGPTRSGSDGKYRITSVAAGKYNLWAEAPDRACFALDSFAVEAGKKNAAPDLILTEGSWIEGRLVEAGTRKPISGAAKDGQLRIGLYGPSRPKSGAACQSCLVDDQGHFSLRVPPGINFPYIMNGDYQQRTQRRDYFEKGVEVKPGEVVNIEFRILPTKPIPDPEPAPVRLAVPAPAERDAAALIRRLGGWYKVDADNHVVEVNMVYHETAEKLRYDNSMIDSDEALRSVSSFPRLKRLFLTKGQATDDGLRTLTGLSDLEVLFVWDASRITDAGISHLVGLKKLRELGFSNAKLSDDAVAVFSRLPAIKELSLQGNSFSDDGLKHLAGLKQLRTLWVGMNRKPITDAGAKHLAGLAALEQLDLQGAKLSDMGVAALKNLKELRVLYLTGDPEAVTDASVEHILGMTKLRDLGVYNSRLTEQGLQRLLGLVDLKHLSFSSSAFPSERRDQLQKQRPDLRIVFCVD